MLLLSYHGRRIKKKKTEKSTGLLDLPGDLPNVVA
jgi:hypothetical protein